MCILPVKFRTNGHSNSSRYWNFSRTLRDSPTAPKYAPNFFHHACPETASIRPWTSSSMSIDTSHLNGGGRSHQRMHNTNKSNDKKETIQSLTKKENWQCHCNTAVEADEYGVAIYFQSSFIQYTGWSDDTRVYGHDRHFVGINASSKMQNIYLVIQIVSLRRCPYDH